MFKAISLLLSSTILSSFFTFLIQLITARNLSPSDFGIVMSSLTLVVLLSPLLAIGLDGYILKFHAENRGLTKSFVKSSFYYLLISLPLTFILYVVIGSDIGSLFFILVVSQFLINLSISLKQVEGDYSKISLILSLQSMTRLILLLALLASSLLNLKSIYYMYVLAALLVIVACLMVVIKSIRATPYHEMSSSFDIFTIFKKSYPFGIGVFLHLIYFQSAIIVLSKLDSPESAGLYGVAFTILTLAYLFPGVVFQKYLLPKIHYLSEVGDSKSLMHIFSNGFVLMLVSGVIFNILLYLMSSFIVDLIFGESYAESILILQVLSVCITFRYLSSCAGVFLLTDNLVSTKNKYMAMCAVFNLSLNIIFIPIYGITAAVIITILSEIFLTFLYYRGLFRHKFKDQNFLDLFRLAKARV